MGGRQRFEIDASTAKVLGNHERLETLGGRDRAAHELGRAKEPGVGNRKLGKDAGGWWKSRRGRAVFMVVREQQRGRERAYPD
jgi:hypothetical protein